MSIDVAPDGETLIFDLLGDIYRLPIDGGVAAPLTHGRAWDQAPRFSPDGRHVYFISDREGFKNIWRLTLSDQSIKQITTAASHVLGPNWSQGGSHLLAGVGDQATHNTEVILHAIDPNNGIMTPINAPSGPWIDWDTFEHHRPPIRVYSGVESSDGNVFFARQEVKTKLEIPVSRLYVFNVKAEKRTAITPLDAQHNDYKPQLSHDGKLLAYFRQYNDHRTELRLRNRTTGHDEALIELLNPDDPFFSPLDDSRPNYAFTPNNQHLIFWHGGKIHRVDVITGASEIIPFRVKVKREVLERAKPPVGNISDTGEAKIIRWPTASRDGKTMAFAAIGYIWVMDLGSDQVRRLTNSSDFEYMPAISPDARSVAYISFAQTDNDYGPGRLVVADVDNGTPRDVLAASNETYLLPKWSPDGEKIAVIRETESEDGLEATFGWTPVLSSTFHSVATAPASSDLASLYIYARYVGFDESGDNLLFSYPRSKTETVLASAGLDGRPPRTLSVGTPEVGGITPSPDLNHLALTRQDGTVWVVPFREGLRRHHVSTSSQAARRVSVGGGYYVNWNSPNQMTFGFGQNVYVHKLDCSEPESIHIQVTFAKPMASRPIAFTGGRLITLSGDEGAGAVIESGMVVLKGQRIAAVGHRREVEIPPNSIVIDVTGKTIIPGLIDTHYHRIGGSNGAIGVSAFKLPNQNFGDPSAIAYGVTMAWEPAGPANDGAPATVDLKRAGRILGPRWSHSATALPDYLWDQLTTYANALAAVEQDKELGVAVLKEYNAPTRAQQQWLSTAAHQSGVAIVSHIQSFDGMMTRVVDGYTGGDHPFIPVPLFKDVIELLRRTGYIWTPNVDITIGNVGPSNDTKRYFWRELGDIRSWEHEKLKEVTTSDRVSKKDITDKPSVPYQAHRVSRVAEQAASAARAGVHIGVSAHNMPGLGLHREMWYLWKGGMPIDEVLRAATIGNAEKLGLQDEIGSLEPGKIADLLVLDKNPLDNILNTLSLRYTVQGGVVYDSYTAQRADLINIQEDNQQRPSASASR